MSDDIEKDASIHTSGSPRGGQSTGDGSMARSDATRELGVSGLKGARPVEGWLYEEFLPQLRGIRGSQIYREMADNDPVIGAALFAFKMLLRQIPWTIVAADKSSAAEDSKQWAEQVLFQDMTMPFSAFVEDALSFLQYGFAPVEVVFKVRRGEKKDPRQSSQFDDGTIGVGKMAVRAQDTVWRWHFDEFGELLYLEQFRIGQVNAMIPRDKLLMMRTENTLGNPEGRSLLRNAYRSYTRKNTIEEAEGRAALRTAGVVVMRIPGRLLEANVSGDELTMRNAYQAIANKMAQDAMGAILLPSDVDANTKTPVVDVTYLTTDTGSARGVDMSAIIERYDKRILSTMMADFILLGQQSVGSFALSDSKTAMFGKACNAFLGAIADQVNRVLLTRLWRLNGFKPELKPTVKPGDVEAVDIDKLGMFILRIAQAGGQLFPDPQLEAELKSMAKLPTTSEEG